MKKILFLILPMFIFSAEFNVKDYESFKNNKTVLNEKEFLPKEKFNSNELLKTNSNKIDLSRQLDLSKSLFNGNDFKFLNKNEFNQLDNEIVDSVNNLKGPHEFILYFYSESVPKSTIANIIDDIYLLQKNGKKILTKQYMFGLPKDPQKYFMEWKDYSESLSSSKKIGLGDNFAFKTDSRFFKMYEIKQVPAVALATCSTVNPDPMSCEIKYLIHGDAPLITFFDKISKIDNSYKEYYNILNMNGLNINEVKLK